MAATGTATVDFGALPGTGDASTVITGQSTILSGSLVEAWLVPADSTDHTADEHRVDGPRVMAGNVIAGTGFTIYATAEERPGSRLYGVWSVAWVWA
jgi:hypothetical protein